MRSSDIQPTQKSAARALLSAEPRLLRWAVEGRSGWPANSGRSDRKSRCPKADNRVPREGLWKTANSRGNVCLQCYEPMVSMRQVTSCRSATKIRASLQPRGA
jgi:hypothetical protein